VHVPAAAGLCGRMAAIMILDIITWGAGPGWSVVVGGILVDGGRVGSVGAVCPLHAQLLRLVSVRRSFPAVRRLIETMLKFVIFPIRGAGQTATLWGLRTLQKGMTMLIELGAKDAS